MLKQIAEAPMEFTKLGCRVECSRATADAAGKPGCDLLQHPTVAVGIAERSQREVAAMLGIRTTDRAVRAEVENLAHLDAGSDQLVPDILDVENDQVRLG